MMMGGNRRTKSITDLLSDPDALKVAIDAHNKAIEARNKSAEDHKKTKTEALETIRQLEQKQSEHDEREFNLNNRHNALSELSGQLNAQIADYSFKLKELEDAKAAFENRRTNQQLIFQQKSDEILAKEQITIQKHQDLEQKLLDAAKRHHDLSIKEALLVQRENEILAFADRLKGL